MHTNNRHERVTKWILAAGLCVLCGGCDEAEDDGATTAGATDGGTTGATDGTGDGSGESSGTEAGSQDGLEIVGSYVENFASGSGSHEITETTWTQDFDGFVVNLDVLSYDNESDWLVTEDADNPGVFSKIQWTYAGDDLYYCSVVFDATSEQAALDAPPADDSDPANTGCGGFPWSALTPA